MVKNSKIKRSLKVKKRSKRGQNVRFSLKIQILMRDFDKVVLFCHYIMSKTGYHNN